MKKKIRRNKKIKGSSRIITERKNGGWIPSWSGSTRTVTISELKWYSNLMAELKKYSVAGDDISKFAKMIDNIRSE